MAAPVTTARVNPDTLGTKLDDGYQTLIAFALNATVLFWEKGVTPPGIDGGDAIETTTMHNTTWRTMAARSLKTMTEFSVTAAYDPALYTDILSLVNTNGSITVTFPDSSTLDFFGFLKTFEPNEATEGEQPECTVTITPTNMDEAGVEQAPVFTDQSGTGAS